ncbi:helix-turn-helix transcriptional regulator [Planosporangium flavigriseum]|uniref:Transcriptional regulator n=1 Tax=Planosporangium flavigriseum TaxID=373681 RepID=A0A8J3PMH9_9ACTN|nr:helix-turn-helix transcriptional regulator [Planosporangium flavigriseum]NJC67494.1 helix-turn-helix transcriptional regulator [Planosporangium flavigriseum]GIG75556.1 transcriptional regulator [Planosporangium flavigriseum]
MDGREPTLLRGIGANIAAHRRAAGVTQSDLAARIGKSVQWVSAVEQGRRHADRLSDLLRIAVVVGCTVEDLIGRPVDTLAPGGRPRGEAVAAVREVIMRAAGPAPLPDPAPDLDEVSTRVAEAWTIWHGSPTAHAILGGVLPGLLQDANAAYLATSERKLAARNLAGAYQVTRQWLHHIPDGELAWVAAERAMNAAREADDPHLIALGAWALSASYRRAGQQEEATRLCLAAADELKARIDPDNPQKDLLADYGMLHLAAAVSAAQSDEDGRAWALHRVAGDAARALGAHYDPWTAFGRGNVDIHGLAISAELGHADAVVEYAARLEIDSVPSVERRAAALINTARGFVRRGEDEAAALVLLDAEQISEDEVHDSTLVRELLRELLHRDRARARSHVRGLAQRSGLIAA